MSMLKRLTVNTNSRDEMIEVNLKSIYACCRAAARVMIPRRRGSIVLVSSTAGQRGEPLHSHYAATKGAIISMTKSLAAELGPRTTRQALMIFDVIELSI